MTHPEIQQEQHPEPYVPEGMPEFKVGMRVQWRISPECGWKCRECDENWHCDYPPEGEGIINHIWNSSNGIECSTCYAVKFTKEEGHVYGIAVQESPPDHPEYHGFWAAAAELIPLSNEGR